MKTDNNFVRSGRDRLPNDDYQTLDPRCVLALTSKVPLEGNVCDVCAPMGSGIIESLSSMSLPITLGAVDDAFVPLTGVDWIVTNPPYKRGLVDKIIRAQLQRIYSGDIFGLAILVRTQFDHAKTRWDMFSANPFYEGQIRMCFRPKWFGDGNKTPIHNYVWHIWKTSPGEHPRVWYWREA